MRIGLAGIGIGPLATGPMVATVAREAERLGFATLWAGEHVVMVDEGASRYPYADDGRLAVPPDTDWDDPLIALAWAAAASSTIRLATGILLLPEHLPLVVAKQAATLDALSGGRLTLGVGIGWSKEEFEALGVPFANRAERTVEYVEALRRAWRDRRATMAGRFVEFSDISVAPKPVGRLPVILGGNGPRALARAARHADGWYGFNVDVAATATCVEVLGDELAAQGKDFSGFEVIVAPFSTGVGSGELSELSELGVDEVVLVENPPGDEEGARAWLEDLAHRWVVPARRLGP